MTKKKEKRKSEWWIFVRRPSRYDTSEASDRDLIALSLFQTPVPRSLKLFCFNVLKNLKRAFETKNLDEHQPL